MGALSREIWHNGILPTRADLDVGTTANPVLLTRGPHTTVLNSMALEMAAIDRHRWIQVQRRAVEHCLQALKMCLNH